MKKINYLALIFGGLLLSACALSVMSPTAIPQDIHTPPATPVTQNDPTVFVTQSRLSLEGTAKIIINAIASEDMETVAKYVHPEKGVRFSPYTFVEDTHLAFSADELPKLVDSEEVFNWGVFDGSGDPIELTFNGYYERFLFSSDFSKPDKMAINKVVGSGNTINNIAGFYPGSSFVEYHFSGFDEDYGGMDWVSLRLIFLDENGTWYLVGLVNDQWTG